MEMEDGRTKNTENHSLGEEKSLMAAQLIETVFQVVGIYFSDFVTVTSEYSDPC